MAREKKKKDNGTDPPIPQPGFIPAINYWRALQILKQTPFLALWAAARKEAPGLLFIFVFLAASVVSIAFTIGWCIKTALVLVYRFFAGLISLVVKNVRRR